MKIDPPPIDELRTMTMELSIEEWELLEAIRRYVGDQVNKKLHEIAEKMEK